VPRTTLHLFARVARRLAGPLATIVVASFVISVALSLAPGDPASRLAGPHATLAQVARVRHQLGLDESAVTRYGDWVSGLFHGHLGTSIVYRSSVTSLIGPRIGTTLLLVAYAALLIFVAGIGLGILGGAVRPLGPVVAAVTGLGIAVPTFVAAVLLVNWFALDLGWFPATGSGSGLVGQLRHLTLPAVALALSWSAYVAQITRASIQEERSRDHVDAALGRGLAPLTVFRRHVLRNAAVPIVTVSGLTIAGLVASSVIVESAFGLSGIGSLLVESVSDKDYNVVQAIAVILVILFVVVTTAIDALHPVLDPRLRSSGAPGAA
jgi:peptide/nickel transport system permease protein